MPMCDLRRVGIHCNAREHSACFVDVTLLAHSIGVVQVDATQERRAHFESNSFSWVRRRTNKCVPPVIKCPGSGSVTPFVDIGRRPGESKQLCDAHGRVPYDVTHRKRLCVCNFVHCRYDLEGCRRLGGKQAEECQYEKKHTLTFFYRCAEPPSRIIPSKFTNGAEK